MADNLKEKFTALGERLKIGGAEVGRKVSERMGNVSERVREMFQASNAAVDRLVEEATGLQGFDPDWGQFMEICDMVNADKITGQDLARAIKKRMGSCKESRGITLVLLLLEAVVKNCDKMFAEVASERILDEMVRLVDDPRSSPENRDKALKLIESWGEATEELRYLPVFEETYKSLKSRGVKFPGRDAESLAPIFTPPQTVETAPVRSGISRLTLRDVVGSHPTREDNSDHEKEVFDVARNSIELLSTVLTSSPQQEVLKEELTIALVEQCRQSQFNIQRIIERVGENEALLFEALNVNDELQKALDKYEEMSSAVAPLPPPSELPKSDDSAFVIVDEEPELDDPLVRNKSSKAGARPSPTEDPLADLDKMIFGNKAEEEASNDKKKKPADDLIAF
ncbi:hypothetical protein SELMODRAFT_232686 [Selaginella moellendorffii]|uniref:VHS domain-containing protein n=1 Tax=Selaginella moellendorffii TaxID=88036 RepID=D8RYA9_SELML|nr:TOM1-like protein 1 [Selaginella moellendorffii]EFJ22874.1 hypothetical protein SELMODRAFT_232686 [Selaginella moellendorffii]|eukprot:XP_002975969.1 TOM1-like protein 1 [Selaginella moellendorffii]